MNLLHLTAALLVVEKDIKNAKQTEERKGKNPTSSLYIQETPLPGDKKERQDCSC